MLQPVITEDRLQICLKTESVTTDREDTQSPKVQGLKPRENGYEAKVCDNRVAADGRNSQAIGFCHKQGPGTGGCPPRSLSTFLRRPQEYPNSTPTTFQKDICPQPNP